MDGDKGYKVGEAPQEKTIRQLKNLKNFIFIYFLRWIEYS